MPYHTQLCHVERLLALPEGAHDDQVRNTLGNSVTAMFSVPTAIFCFLRAQTSIPQIDVSGEPSYLIVESSTQLLQTILFL